jgi:biotin synthase-related radical SAM superfamily protein
MSSANLSMLSRVSWPVFETERVLVKMARAVQNRRIKRVCVQALNYPRVVDDLVALVRAVRRCSRVPVSVSCQPADGEDVERLAEAGVDRVGIPLDAASKEVFDGVKGINVGGPYRWERQFELLQKAIRVLGRGRVTTHLIVGLGESERDMADTIQRCKDMGVLPALFAFTPVAGTLLHGRSQPPVQSYRRMQTIRFLIVKGIVSFDMMRFDNNGCINDFGIGEGNLLDGVGSGGAFLTSGCPDCNRPFYNERPSGPIYNYPKVLSPRELLEAKKQLGLGPV